MFWRKWRATEGDIIEWFDRLKGVRQRGKVVRVVEVRSAPRPQLVRRYVVRQMIETHRGGWAVGRRLLIAPAQWVTKVRTRRQ